MSTTEAFKNVIKSYLDTRSQSDNLFAVSYAKPNKNIDDCCTYILNTVKKSGCSGFADEDIFGMAVHYYDEENLEIGNPVSAKIVINRTTERNNPETKSMPKKPKVKKEKADINQLSLF